MEPRKNFSPGCRRCSESGRQNGEVRECEHPDDPAWSKTLACMEAPCAGTGRSPSWPFGTGKGPHRKGEEPKPMMHEREKSDLRIVAKKPANKPGQPGAESVERRQGAEGNMEEPRTRRTPSRESVPRGLARVRQAATPLCRHSPEVGARCANRARRDLCGGCWVTGIPTAIPIYLPDSLRFCQGLERGALI